MNARIAIDVSRPHAAEPVKSAPKHAPSSFDHALQQASPPPPSSSKKPAPSAPSQQGAPQQQAKRDSKQQPQPRSEQDELRNARLLAALHGMPLTQLVVPRVMPSPINTSVEAEPPMAIEAAVRPAPVTQDEIPTSPGIEPTTAGKTEVVDNDARFELPDEMEPAEDTLTDVPPAMDAQSNEVDPAQVAQLIASTHVEASPKTEESHHDATVDVAALQGATRTDVAEPTRAVEAAAPVRDVQWHGLAESIANGSIEGNRARVVIGQGDDRIVLTVATHAHRVSVEVETSTIAGQQLADQLRGGADDLRHALQRHGLDLADQRSSKQEADAEEQPLPVEPKKQATPTIARPTGVVA